MNKVKLLPKGLLAGIGSWELDLKSGQALWSKEMCRICGLQDEPHSLGANSIVTFIHEDDRELYGRWFARLQAGSDLGTVEYRINSAHSQYRIVRADGEVITAPDGTGRTFPVEQARIVQLLVERVDVSPEGADIRLRTEGLTNLVADLRAVRPEPRRAA